ncbi:MAG: DUF1232 domain-containing protein [Anaerolineaceae bacterium]|nr:DUF1232 domain-containing protein [Anaerolineaceae bacterium]
MIRLFKEMFIIFLALVALLYLLNPTLGIFEFLPDNLPLVGNLDEGLAVVILLNTARYYGIDLTRLYSRGDKRSLPPPR